MRPSRTAPPCKRACSVADLRRRAARWLRRARRSCSSTWYAHSAHTVECSHAVGLIIAGGWRSRNGWRLRNGTIWHAAAGQVPLSLGIETTGRVMSTVVKRNTQIPCRKSDTFTTEEDWQARPFHSTHGRIAPRPNERTLATTDRSRHRHLFINIVITDRGRHRHSFIYIIITDRGRHRHLFIYIIITDRGRHRHLRGRACVDGRM